MTDVQHQLDDEAVRMMAFQVWSYKQGEMVSLLIHLGDRLGLYAAMAGAGPLSSAELAERAGGLSERWVREWVSAQAAAGLVEHSVIDEHDRFELTPAGRAVLLDEGSSVFAAVGAFAGPMDPDLVDDLAECFRTGIGLPYDRQGPRGAHRTERMLGPWAELALVPVILPMLDGVVDKLEAGADVLDVGWDPGWRSRPWPAPSRRHGSSATTRRSTPSTGPARSWPRSATPRSSVAGPRTSRPTAGSTSRSRSTASTT
jgi:hypothetical protein